MCFRDPYDALDSSMMRELNGMLLDQATKKEEMKRTKVQRKEQKRQEKEQKRIAKVKEELRQKYGPMLQPAPSIRQKRCGSGSSSSEDTHPCRHCRHHRRSHDSECAPKHKITGEDREGAPAHITHIEFGEFHSAPPPKPTLREPPPLEVESETAVKASKPEKSPRE